MHTLNIAIAGASGRMGQILIETALSEPSMQLTSVLDRAGGPLVGQDIAVFLGLGQPTGIVVSDDIEKVFTQAECLIDFTRPQATMTYLHAARRHRNKLVIGTTGLTAEQKAELKAASKTLPIVFAPNMSIGVNVTFKLLDIAARLLSTGYDIEIIEAHHRHKIDAPSGTALKMGEIAAKARDLDLSQAAVYSRQGVTGERDPATIGFAVVRGGDIVGDHTALFAGMGERVEITHRAFNRISYAQGALRAARFIADQASGLFDMQDVLRLR